MATITIGTKVDNDFGFGFGFGFTSGASAGPVDPLAGISFTLRFQTHKGEVSGTGSFFSVSDGTDPDFDGDYYPNGETQNAKPVYQLDGGTALMVYNESEGFWELVDGGAPVASGGSPSNPGIGVWTNGYNVSEGTFSIFTPIGLYQDTACTIPAMVDGDLIAGVKDEVGNTGIIATQPNAAKQPYLLFVRGVPTITGDGVDDWLECDNVLAAPFASTIAAQEVGANFTMYGGRFNGVNDRDWNVMPPVVVRYDNANHAYTLTPTLSGAFVETATETVLGGNAYVTATGNSAVPVGFPESATMGILSNGPDNSSYGSHSIVALYFYPIANRSQVETYAATLIVP